MPHVPVHPSAVKRHRQNLRRRARNRAIKSRVHSAIALAHEALEGTDAVAAQQAVRAAEKVLTKSVTKGTIHGKTASRKVSRLASSLHKKFSQAAN